MGGMSDSDKQNVLKDTINSMQLGTFGSRRELERCISGRLTEDEKYYLRSNRVNTFYQNQIDIIWKQKCIEKIKQKINEYNDKDICISSRNALKDRVRQELRGVDNDFYDDNQIINELNSTWNNINGKVKNKITHILNSIRNEGNMFNSNEYLYDYIKLQLNEAEKEFFRPENYRNQINIIWKEKIKQKINDYNYNNIYVSSRNDLLYRVQNEFYNVDQSLFENNQIINELNRIWNNIETKINRLKERIENKFRDILLYDNDSINSHGDLTLKIKEEFNEADKKLLNDGEMDDYLRRKIRNNWSRICKERRKKIEEKIKGISDICLTLYEHCQTIDEFKKEIEKKFFNDNDRNNIKDDLEMIFQLRIENCWRDLENIKIEKTRKKKEEEKDLDNLWIELYNQQNELLKEMKESYEQKISEFEDKLKNMEEKDKDFKGLRIKNILESRKKKPNKLDDFCDNETPGNNICEIEEDESMVANEFNKLWDEFLASQKKVDEELINKNDEFKETLTKKIEEIKRKLGKYDEKTNKMLEELIESNKNELLKNFEAFKVTFESQLKKEKEQLNEEYQHEIKKYKKPDEKNK